MKRSLFNLIAALLLCCVASSVSAQFSGSGSGTADDPYRIFNAVQLNQVRNFLNKEDVYFSLEADIDMTDWIAENSPVSGWQPIGNPPSSFMGTFNGNGHTISNLWINRPDDKYIGLFGCVEGGSILNLNLDDANYLGESSIGGIVGSFSPYNGSASISSCFFSGKISGTYNVGGIAGEASGDNEYTVEITNCSTDCIIDASENNEMTHENSHYHLQP